MQKFFLIAVSLLLFGCDVSLNDGKMEMNQDPRGKVECVLQIRYNYDENKHVKYLKTMERMSKKQFIIIPATDSRDYRNPIIYYFVVSYKPCDESIRLLEGYSQERSRDYITQSDLLTYTKALNGIEIFK